MSLEVNVRATAEEPSGAENTLGGNRYWQLEFEFRASGGLRSRFIVEEPYALTRSHWCAIADGEVVRTGLYGGNGEGAIFIVRASTELQCDPEVIALRGERRAAVHDAQFGADPTDPNWVAPTPTPTPTLLFTAHPSGGGGDVVALIEAPLAAVKPALRAAIDDATAKGFHFAAECTL